MVKAKVRRTYYEGGLPTWNVWIPPRDEGDYEEDGTIAGPFGDSYWPTWKAAVDFALETVTGLAPLERALRNAENVERLYDSLRKVHGIQPHTTRTMHALTAWNDAKKMMRAGEGTPEVFELARRALRILGIPEERLTPVLAVYQGLLQRGTP